MTVHDFAFVRAHHRFIARVATVGDRSWLKLLPKLAAVFVAAEPRYFDLSEIEAARAWVAGDAR